jgi:holo-[acyl-carrier protein] synthase
VIFGIGIDIVQISRVRAGLERFGERYARRILSAQELVEFEARRRSPSFIASRFAAKEALVKAMGTGFRGGIALHEICVTRDHRGRPEIECTGRAREFLSLHAIDRAHLSLSDEIDYAVAFVTLEITLGQ